MPKAYRSRTRLVLDLLRAVRDEGDAQVTRLLFVANLSHPRLKELLDELVGRGWVQGAENDGKPVWRITAEGRQVLVELEKVDRFMADFGLGL